MSNNPPMIERLARAAQKEMLSAPNCNSQAVCTLPPCGCSERLVRAVLTELRQLYGLETVPLNKIAENPAAGWRERAVQAFARMLKV